jgi:hypothetical protein
MMTVKLMGLASTGDTRLTTNLAVRGDVESLAKDILLHFRMAVLVELLSDAFAEHLVLGPDVHRDLQKSFVQEWNAGFETPRHRGSFEKKKTWSVIAIGGDSAVFIITHLLARR